MPRASRRSSRDDAWGDDDDLLPARLLPTPRYAITPTRLRFTFKERTAHFATPLITRTCRWLADDNARLIL